MKINHRIITLAALVCVLSFSLIACLTGNTATDPPANATTKALFLFAGEDGSILAWSSGNNAVRMTRSASDKGVYKSLAIASLNGTHFIYATNFKESTIDIYDTGFHHAQGNPFQGASFVDKGSPAIPSDYGPFGIRNIGGLLYVTYAKHKAPDNEDDDAGPGNGYVSVFNPDGTFVMRLASNGALNSPWAVSKAPAGFGVFANQILVGNFGDGWINAYRADGTYLGALKDPSGNPIAIDGLWDATFADPAVSSGIDYNTLFFTAGPDDESHGLFGKITISGSGYQMTPLTSDTAGYGAPNIDPNLVNAWGIAIGPTGKPWISSADKGLSVIYDASGAQARPPVTIPARNAETGGAPTGQVFNTTNDFMMPKQ